MDMNQHNDNLEHFFRKGLNENADLMPESGSWDMPSDSVWNAIEEALPKERNRFSFIPIISIAPIRRLKWASAASVLLLFSVYLGYHNQQKIKTMQNEMAIQSELFQTLEKENIKSIVSQEAANTELAVLAEVKTVLAKANNNTTIVEKEQLNNRTPISFQPERATITPLVANDPISLLPNLIDPLELNSNECSLFPINTSITYNLPNPKMYAAEIIKPVKKRNKFYAGIFTGPSRWKTKIVQKVNDAFFPKGKLEKERGIETGFKLGWQIANNWSIETGLSFAKNTRTMQQEKSFRFDSNKESLNADGNLQSSYDSQMYTPFGNTTIALDVTRAPETILSDGEVLDIAFNNDITTNLVQLPLTARYNIQKGKLNLSLSAGILLSFLQDHYIKMPEGNLGDNPMLLEEHARLKNQTPDLNTMHYAIQGGVQVAYEVTENLEVYLAPTAAKGLSPIAESEEMSTTLAQVGLMAGVNVRF